MQRAAKVGRAGRPVLRHRRVALQVVRKVLMDLGEAASLMTALVLPSEVYQVTDGQCSCGVLKAGVDIVSMEDLDLNYLSSPCTCDMALKYER